MMRTTIVATIALVVVSATACNAFDLTKEQFNAFLCDGQAMPCFDDETVTPRELVGLLAKAAEKLKKITGRKSRPMDELIKDNLAGAHSTDKVKAEVPYFRFVPTYFGSLMQPGDSISFASPCFTNITATLRAEANVTDLGTLVPVDLVGTGMVEKGCYSNVWFSIGYASTAHLVQTEGAKTTAFVNITEFDATNMWDFKAHGVRTYLFNDTHFEMLADMIDTALLFLPNFEDKPPGPITTAMNMQYFNVLTGIKPAFSYRKFNNSALLPGFDDSWIQSGDIMFMTEMEGLALTIGLGAGTSAGHTTIFLRNETTNVLHVCESTDPWIRCTPFKPWVKMMLDEKAGNLVWLPLQDEYRAKFNLTAAWEYVETQLGFSYGYNTFAFGWIDTLEENYPCFPPDFKRCLVWSHVEYGLLFLERFAPKAVNKVAGQAFMNRLNMSIYSNYSVAELFMIAETQFNITGNKLTTLVEKDSYNYLTTKYKKPAVGKAMTCSTFACNVHKHAGVYSAINGNIECGEQTPFNVGAFQIYNQSQMFAGRPKVCRDADPTNRLCQLSGSIEFHLEVDVNSMPMYEQMGDHCQSKNDQGYRRSPGC